MSVHDDIIYEAIRRIVDDGRGVARIVAGNGLTGMRERAAEVGGSLALESRPGAGCQVGLWLPMEGGRS